MSKEKAPSNAGSLRRLSGGAWLPEFGPGDFDFGSRWGFDGEGVGIGGEGFRKDFVASLFYFEVVGFGRGGDT
jgi:hypothetical protein